MNQVKPDKANFKIANPFYQAGGIFILLIISQFVIKSGDYEEKVYWQMGLLFQMIFILFNILMGFQITRFGKYWKQSALAFAGLTVIGIFVVAQFSGQSLGDAGLTRRMYNLFIVVFGILHVMMGLARWVVRYAEEEKWTKPRSKSR
jgi:hypothetical protein